VGAVLAKQHGSVDGRLRNIEGRLGIPDKESARLLQLIKKVRGTRRREPSLLEWSNAISIRAGSRSYRRRLQSSGVEAER